ncbi:competence type IV pilus major pilin ComGC [Companilactobacillus musae]|uniref:competence type IV pilus major pilin ComGC n=1 Tax=Companilactobacillus musae TaxID=1903258 RepID=UPI000E6541DF|nr:competence type IV pilus major pilin ComGC [Companilactobacillus musae]
MKKTRKAFTLIEMVIVLFIISLLLLIMIPNLADQRNKATKKSDEAFVTTIKTQEEMYENDNGAKKPTLDELKNEGYITENQLKKAKDFKEELTNEN